MNEMSFSERTQAILLLTAHFSKQKKGDITPLTLKEYGRFAHWLKEKSLNPERLLKGDLFELLQGWADKKITFDRLIFLLNRGTALALASEKWKRVGLWVVTRSEKDYPELLRLRLKNDCPPLLFGSGNRRLLNQKSIAVVGSRNVSNLDLAFSRNLGKLAAKEGVSIVSGGARGVDEASMLGTLEVEW
jgi:predicted Rossmann fold nucleotide-binding protein DprA/Smf involved in DNA uptake